MNFALSCLTDDEAPAMNCPKIQSTYMYADFNQSSDVVSWANIEATDNSGQIPTVTCSIKSTTEFKIGKTDVKCQAVDPSGNHAICNFTVQSKGMETYLCK